MNERREWQRAEPAFSGIFSRTFLLATAVLLLATWALRSFGPGLLVPDAEARIVTPRGELAADELSTIELFENASPAVVHIETAEARTFLGTVHEGSGSGFLWDEQGHVVTNYHVVQDARWFKVRLQDGRTREARLVGFAKDFDLAVLRIDLGPREAWPLPLGTSEDLRVGQKVFAIGNPFGLDQTLTTGVISGLERSIASRGDFDIHGVIQTDAAINPGNSGGPLLDSAGRLIGVNTAIASPSGAYAGVGFAVPVDTVNRVVPRILREGAVRRAYMGVLTGEDLMARDVGVDGAVVAIVPPDGPASRAGLRGAVRGLDGEVSLRDVIVRVDGRRVRGREDLFRFLEEYSAGDVVLVGVSRVEGGKRVEVDVEVELGERE